MPETINLELRGGDFQAEVVRGGSGPPLLYLHGAIGQKGWSPFLERLARQFTVYAPYMPGYGNSGGLEHLEDLHDLIIYHFALLDALDVPRAHIVGHSLGGMIAAEMAAMAPGVVDRLVLASPAGLWRDEDPVADLLALNADELLERLTATPDGADSLDGLRDMLSRDRMQDIAAAGKFLWPIPDRGLKRRAYRIKSPTLILWGGEDRINPPSYAADFQSLITGSRTATLLNAGHLLMLEQADAFADAVAGFLGGE
jgi:pimeloyl-ACP methyl ester carboxylesterase